MKLVFFICLVCLSCLFIVWHVKNQSAKDAHVMNNYTEIPPPTWSVPKHDVVMTDASKDMDEWYAIYNVLYFDGQLPTDTIIQCSTFPEKVEAQGMTTKADDGTIVILVQSSLCWGNRVYLPVLIHEMVHVALRDDPEVHGDAEHGEKFRNEMHRLALAGAFDDLW